MTSIEPFNLSHVSEIISVTLFKEQVKFAETAEGYLSDESETVHRYIIKSDNNVVGFFKIDLAYSLTHVFCPKNGVGLRMFVVDRRHQGKGIGADALKVLFPYLKENYYSFDTIYLTVNCKNPAAQRCYQKAGFEYTGENYLGGAVGPQEIMKRKIR